MSEHSTKQKHKVLGTPKRGNVSGEASLRRKGSIGYRRMARRSQGRLKRRKRVLDLGVNACSVVQSLNDVQLFETPWTAARQAPLSFTISWSLHRSMSFESVMLSNHLILCHPLLLLPSILPHIRDFFNELVLRIRWPNWSFSFSISLSSKYSGLVSFRIDWFDLLVVQGTLKSLLQHHSSKTLILRHSDFFTVQLSHPYMTTGKTIALTRRTIVGKVMSLLFNMLSRLVISFFPRSKCLLIL